MALVQVEVLEAKTQSRRWWWVLPQVEKIWNWPWCKGGSGMMHCLVLICKSKLEIVHIPFHFALWSWRCSKFSRHTGISNLFFRSTLPRSGKMKLSWVSSAFPHFAESREESLPVGSHFRYSLPANRSKWFFSGVPYLSPSATRKSTACKLGFKIFLW